MDKLKSYLTANKERHLAELDELIALPSISAQSQHKKDIETTANWLKTHLTKIGLENAQVLDTGGHPVVYAEWLHANTQPTVLIYGHYDVQAPDPLTEWLTDPFKLTVKNGNMYARGANDNKGQFFTHIKALEAILAVEGKLPVNVKIMLEGEEEIGGPHLGNFVENNKKLLSADICLVSDTPSTSETQPTIVTGLRGLIYTQIYLQTMPKDAHSGGYGGNIPNPAAELASIISQLKSPKTQKVLIPEFYDKVRKLTDKDLTELKKSEITVKSILAETDVKELVGLHNKLPAERAGALPTLDVNGMYSGYVDEGAKTIIPAKASAKISMRLVPHQTADEIIAKYTSFLTEIVPKYVDLEIKILSKDDPIIVNTNSEYFEKASAALETVFGAKPNFEFEGGSIPVTSHFKKHLNIDTILMGFGLPDDGLHSPNEKMSLTMFYKGIETSALFFTSI